MRFNCGQTASEKAHARVLKNREWHRYFCWYPTRVGHNDCRWLEYVWRKGQIEWSNGDHYHLWDYEYRPLNFEA